MASLTLQSTIREGDQVILKKEKNIRVVQVHKTRYVFVIYSCERYNGMFGPGATPTDGLAQSFRLLKSATVYSTHDSSGFLSD